VLEGIPLSELDIGKDANATPIQDEYFKGPSGNTPKDLLPFFANALRRNRKRGNPGTENKGQENAGAGESKG
jgi:hypothetical protein